MNGRIYDPTLGRFLQADPHIQAPLNSQNYNRYSYVLNNPMSYTDPSGYFFKALFKAIGSNQWLSTTISIGLFFVPGCQSGACSAAFNAATTYAVTGSLKAAVIGAFATAISPGGMSAGAFLARGVMGGIANRALGGKFGHGFISAGAGGAAGGMQNPWGRILVSAVIGGTVSELTGGKFRNGALSAAFATAVQAGFNGDFKSYSVTKSLDKLSESLKTDGGGTMELFKSCNGGDASACASLKVQNQKDLKEAYGFIEEHAPSVLEGVGGATSQANVEDIIFDNSKEFFDFRSGTTSFFKGEVTLSSGYNSTADLVETLAHELLHSGDGMLGRMQTNYQDNFSNGNGLRHRQIRVQSRQVKNRYEEWLSQ